jgi:single-strand DNA-binding protein
MKSITIAGRTTRDAELRRTNDGTAVLAFSVAVDDRVSKEKGTLFFDCSMFGNRATALEQHMVKGTAVTVSGDLGTREHGGKTYLQVRVNDVTLQGAKPQSSPARTEREEPAGSYGAPDLDDQIPFAPEWR